MNKIRIQCDHCGKEILRYPSKMKPHNYCSRACLGAAVTAGELEKDYTKVAEHLSQYNREHNKTAMDFSRRCKLRESRLGTGKQTGYGKRFGKHEHVAVAEQVLGRKLLPDEVVHHIDRDRRNNSLSNLVVMTRSDHARLHARCRGEKEVMSDAFQALSVSAEID